MKTILPRRNRAEVSTVKNEFDDVINRFLGEFESPEGFAAVTIPPVNVAETEKAWTFSLELPGMNEKDIQVQLLGRQLVVSGERKWEEEKKGKEFHLVESRYGSFRRAILMPENARLEPDLLAAVYKRGMLEVTVPKMEPTPSLKIPVKTGS
jgi:HSP20 family protein